MTDTELRAWLDAHGLGTVADAILAATTSAVGLHLRLVDEDALPLGASKVGGHPDLPPDTAWPRWWKSRVPMAFLAQFDLAEVAPHDPASLLPPRGLLAFFAVLNPDYGGAIGGQTPWWSDIVPDDDGDAPTRDEPPWCVLYYDNAPSSLVRRSFPDDLGLEYHCRACRVRFHTAATLPGRSAPALTMITALQAVDGNLLGDLWAAANLDPEYFVPSANDQDEEGGWHLLGQPWAVPPESPLLLAQRVRYGIEDVDMNRYQIGSWQPSGSNHDYFQAIWGAVERQWCLLLQATDVRINRLFWQGQIYFCIEREALARREFDRTWLIHSQWL